MWMTLLHRGRAHEDEARPGAQFFNVPGAAVAHPGPQPAYQLVDERGQGALVGHTSLDAFGHQLVPAVLALAVAVLGAGHHGADRAHAVVRLEAASLVDDELTRALRQAGQQAADHDP